VSAVHMLPQELYWHGFLLPAVYLILQVLYWDERARITAHLLSSSSPSRHTHSHTQVGVRLLAEIDEKLALSELPPS
jgi:hypothetical protein